MRRHAAFLGLPLAIAVLSMNDAAGQESSQQKRGEIAEKQHPNETVAKLLKTQLQAAQKVHRAAVEGIEGMKMKRIGDLLVLVKGNQHARPELVYAWSVRWLHAQRDLSETKDERIAAFVDHHKRMQELTANVKLLVGGGNSGLLQDHEIPAAEWYLAEAELWLLKERGR